MTRYARQIVLPEIGEDGQKRLADASVLIVGAGGLGSSAALYLAAAGVGHIAIADADEVRLHNLNRQILYNEGDLGSLKSKTAAENLKRFNGEIDIKTLGRVDDSNTFDILNERPYAAVVDGSDNFETRYTINDACIEMGIPFIYGSVLGWVGQVSVFDSRRGPCYRCLYPENPSAELAPTCVRAGVIGVTSGIIGILEAAEAIKLICRCHCEEAKPTKQSRVLMHTNTRLLRFARNDNELESSFEGRNLMGRLLLIDLLKSEFKTVEVTKDPNCPACSNDLPVT